MCHRQGVCPGGDRKLHDPGDRRQSPRTLFINTKTEKPAILLWGGEPLNNWDVFKHAVERAREFEKKYSEKLDISTVTNGTLLTKEIADFLKKNSVRLLVSMEVSQDQHDSMRIYADGRGTYGGT